MTTVDGYASSIQSYIQWCCSRNKSLVPDDITTAMEWSRSVMEFAAYLVKRGYMASSISQFMSAVRFFARSVTGRDCMDKPLQERISKYVRTEGAYSDEYAASAFDIGWLYPYAHLDSLIAELLAIVIGYLFMFRAAEFLAPHNEHPLGWEDVDLLRAPHGALYLRIRVYCTKTNKTGVPTVHIREADPGSPLCVVRLFLAYCKYVPRERRKGPLLRTDRGRGEIMTAGWLSTVMKRVAKEATGSDANISPHSLRKGGATALYKLCGDVHVVMREGRWACEDSLKTYIQLTDLDAACHARGMLSISTRPTAAFSVVSWAPSPSPT